ncbi:helix-turn-helix domain-containing protein [Leucobacter allii]|uniref:Helix-turn-helix domain-containing protein n=1 Tax=Leucobacter allii TaxID=2932247 RepID=A0ABY4FNB3_9MICO|nr:helix-turn-helix domain-containing protein [Leucobacter allii]UOQ57767.1 helix-turn-helix domain-containing protein [Leucobacter allii]UOR02303.1 helix-turn-helix domain-containing protein [Leucobacter allii]
MRPIHPTAAAEPIRIGAKLRSSRLAQGLTLEQLARASGLTKGFISRIERDDTMPSVPTLVQLCQALSLPVGSLFEEPELQLIPLAEAPAINMGGTGADERLVTPRSEDRVQVLRSSLAPGASGGEQLYTVNCNLESLHLVTGTLEIAFADRRVPLAAGDTLTFPGRTPHTWHAGPDGAEAVWVLIPAAWSGSA